MKTDKVGLTMIGITGLLAVLIGWGFYQSLQLESGPSDDYPQKAVMAQAQAMNQARLARLAERGTVAPGMSREQVRTALGEPSRVESREVHGKEGSIWWYENRNITSVLFDHRGNVVKTEEHR